MVVALREAQGWQESAKAGNWQIQEKEDARKASAPSICPPGCHGQDLSWPTSALGHPQNPLFGDREWGSLCYTLLSACPLGFTHTAPEEDTAASSWRPATEAPEPPEEPRLRALTVSSVTPDSLHLSWTVAQGPFDSFVVQYQDIDGQPQALLVGGDQNKVLVSGLEPSTSYRFFLYGLHRGSHLGPVSAEGTTGTCF